MLNHYLDPDLGELEFQDIEGTLSYNCQLALPISAKRVDIFFETNSRDNLPTTDQKQFLKRVIDNYHEILNRIAFECPEEINLTEADKQSFFQNQFYLDTLGIPLNVNINPKWDLSLKSRLDKSMSLLANFENMTPIKVWVENEPKRSLLYRLILKFAKQ